MQFQTETTCLSTVSQFHIGTRDRAVSPLLSIRTFGLEVALTVPDAMRALMRIGKQLALTLALLALVAGLVGATTLQQLSMDEMIQKSTSVVRGRIMGVSVTSRSGDIFTVYQVRVLESLKGSSQPGQSVEISVPGGELNGVRQPVAGAPSFTTGDDYVLFLWKGRSGVNQVMGLSQGMYSVKQDGTGNAVLLRPATTETMVDKSGTLIKDQPSMMKLSELRDHMQSLQTTGANR